MAAEQIGRCKCPVCGGVARLSLAKSQLAVVTCNGCNFQGFARSDRSDEKLRALVIPEQKQDLTPAAPAPAPVAVPAVPPAPAPAPKPAGLWGGW